MEKNSLIVKKTTIFTVLRKMILLFTKINDNSNKTGQRNIDLLKKEYEKGKIELSDFTPEEYDEYNKLLEEEIKELAKKEIREDILLNTAK